MTAFASLTRWALLVPACMALWAGETHTWSQTAYSDFEKGIIKNLSVRSDGLLTLAPDSHEVLDTASAYLWALAEDSKGNLYAGGGTGARLYRITPDGKSKVLADLEGLEIHGIAVDSKDRVYAATSPDGKVYRIQANGKPEVFYDPKAKYIWALAFDSKDNLYIATGDQGEIYRVAPDGKGAVFFKTDETHVRSMAIDSHDNLLVGTDPGGLVLRVSPSGAGFVLYQMPKQEVTSVAVGRDGVIYAAGVGAKRQGALPAAPAAPAPAPAPAPAQAPGSPGAPGGPTVTVARTASPAPASVSGPAAVNGGSDVYRIETDGNPERIWSSSQEIVYAVALDEAGRVLLATGNKGNIYRIESPALYTALLTVPATQVTAFQTGRNGRIYAATANIGKVYRIGPELARQGSIESDVFDAGTHTYWGRLSFTADLNGGSISVATRTGNLDQPQKNWSPWSPAVTSPKGARITSPSARFIQWKATLTAPPTAAKSPALESVDVAYLSKNVEPRVDEIELTPANYKFPASLTLTPSQTLSLPPLGGRLPRTAPRPQPAGESTATPTMQLAKGYLGARWLASDPNGDPLVFNVEIRGSHETAWKPLKDKLSDKYFSWDSTAFPDGEYRLRITASDAPGNPPDQALSASLVSDPFIIDNTPPVISGLTATRNGGKIEVRWHAADALNNIAKAQYSLDGGEWTVVSPVTRLSDSQELDYDVSIAAGPGEHTVAVRVTDDYDNEAAAKVMVEQ
ncbi:MAG TPA: hypothetical protein VG675_18430 [Bryobacteraceae bacterium]|nr:hypothetical protein [Bryobacteraceae bacterium]